ELLWTTRIKERQGNADYWGQPTLALVGTGQVAIMSVMSSGDGKNTNDAGENSNVLGYYDITDQGPVLITEVTSVGPCPRHGGMDAANFGVDCDEQLRALTFQSDATGAGQPTLQFVLFDHKLRTSKVDAHHEQWQV